MVRLPPPRHPSLRGRLRRRQALQATGIGFVATPESILLGAGRTAQAEPVAGGPPVADGLTVRILADNHTDRYSVPLATPGMKSERTSGSETPGQPPVRTLRAEWGLSMLAKSVCAGETRRVDIRTSKAADRYKDFSFHAELHLPRATQFANLTSERRRRFVGLWRRHAKIAIWAQCQKGSCQVRHFPDRVG